MSTGILLLNFGEPATPEREAVVSYLERIFFNNREIEGDTTEAEARERSRELAERRAGPLIEEYEEIGGSPLNEQARGQAQALEERLRERGHDVETYLGMQFTEPFIDEALEAAIADGHDEIIGLPIYPLSGPSTTVDALEELRAAADEREFDALQEISGWHRHPDYPRLRVDNIEAFADERDVDLTDPDTALVFSAHGTPQHYLAEGSRYDIYVTEYVETVAGLLGIDEYELGYQNHENRGIPWTEPEVEDVIERVDAERVVVEPISFMHEQSETLSELDVELREEAEAAGLEFYRVPIPHDDERFVGVLEDLVEPFIADFDPAVYQFRQCQCRDEPGTMCLNAPLE
ncbi:Ferrochelatase protein [Halorhabdus tiamatea SARL4B]|uniref:Ferrochelatase n=1 Tax=Halorhabdus tiamatea SARL4B TaxID=1033806 RepID=F7PPL4_9EURY|nr:ferrochelatase [Halorhabdus tiamatea]ERJ06177.1 Ferrochelatase protein [Halorhabdus tiamatea SARL4B]CCQ34046.1 ferrochelatase [Halorhabdus tiamatea SARL4B]